MITSVGPSSVSVPAVRGLGTAGRVGSMAAGNRPRSVSTVARSRSIRPLSSATNTSRPATARATASPAVIAVASSRAVTTATRAGWRTRSRSRARRTVPSSGRPVLSRASATLRMRRSADSHRKASTRPITVPPSSPPASSNDELPEVVANSCSALRVTQPGFTSTAAISVRAELSWVSWLLMPPSSATAASAAAASRALLILRCTVLRWATIFSMLSSYEFSISSRCFSYIPRRMSR